MPLVPCQTQIALEELSLQKALQGPNQEEEEEAVAEASPLDAEVQPQGGKARSRVAINLVAPDQGAAADQVEVLVPVVVGAVVIQPVPPPCNHH